MLLHTCFLLSLPFPDWLLYAENDAWYSIPHPYSPVTVIWISSSLKLFIFVRRATKSSLELNAMAIFSHLGPSSIFPGQIAREAAFGPGHDLASKVVVAVKNLPASAGDKRYRFDPWFGRRAWQPTSVFLPGESHGQRSLAGYSP